MINDEHVKETLSFLEKDLIDQILKYSELSSFPTDVVLIREGQYLKHLPVILDGIVKVYSQHDDKEMLLYYIKPQQSCIISFAAATHNKPSMISAVTETESKILLLPTTKISKWTSSFPRFNQLFFDLYHQRYLDLLETINQLVFNTLDHRIYVYLKELSRNTSAEFLDIRHHKIAKDLGTAREVVSRVLKKLERENKIMQVAKGIKVFTHGD